MRWSQPPASQGFKSGAYPGRRSTQTPRQGVLARLLDDQSLGRVWLIDSGGATVGYVVLIFSHSLEFDGRDAYVDEIYLQERYRGRGLGPEALLFAEGVCAALGVRALHLGVDRNNRRARAAYLKAGFANRNHFLLTKRIATLSG